MKKPVVLFIILLFPALLYLVLSTGKHKMMRLPIYYPLDVQTIEVDGKERVDTIYHSLPQFSLLDQDSQTVTLKDLENKVVVADFFFSTCPGICPRMMTNMAIVNAAMTKRQDFAIVSHSVNPERDTVRALAEYSKLVGAVAPRWRLLTGPKKDIYDLGMDGYKLAVDEDPRAPGGFLHSEMFVLLDKQQRIRGYYDGTDTAQVNKLINDVKILFAEYESKAGKPKIVQQR